MYESEIWEAGFNVQLFRPAITAEDCIRGLILGLGRLPTRAELSLFLDGRETRLEMMLDSKHDDLRPHDV